MNNSVHRKKNLLEFDFPACKRDATLLQTALETKAAQFYGGAILNSSACSSVEIFRLTPQAGEVLLGLV
jgi:hypothetical protein